MINNDKQKQNQDNCNKDIINELIALELGTKSQIINAMNNVENKNDINQIAEYLISDTHENDNNNVCYILSYIFLY